MQSEILFSAIPSINRMMFVSNSCRLTLISVYPTFLSFPNSNHRQLTVT